MKYFDMIRQAPGLPHAAISWTSSFHEKIRRKARKKLDDFARKHA